MPSPKRKKKKRAVPSILPREPLTKKARAAIDAYVRYKSGNVSASMPDVIRWTLDAERMRRSDLYEFLSGKGYKWDTKRSYWWVGVGRERVGRASRSRSGAVDITNDVKELLEEYLERSA